MKIIFFGDSLTEGLPGASFLDVLKKKLPDYELINQGSGGDTITTLYYRVQYFRLREPADISFLWVGVNDVWGEYLGNYQDWDDMIAEIKDYYCRTLDVLSSQSELLVTVSPLFIGENIDNEWNEKLKEITGIIEEVSSGYKNVEFLNLRDAFLEKTAPLNIRRSLPEDLHFTIDGVHLNERGAGIVAEIFLEKINDIAGNKNPNLLR